MAGVDEEDKLTARALVIAARRRVLWTMSQQARMGFLPEAYTMLGIPDCLGP